MIAEAERRQRDRRIVQAAFDWLHVEPLDGELDDVLAEFYEDDPE